jgi:prolyl oligopeptidase
MIPTRTDQIVEDHHGIKVADPYRWLEHPESNETKEWVAAQNRVTSDFIHSIPSHAPIHSRLKELWNYTKYMTPRKVGDRYFFLKNNGLQNQYVLYMQDSLKSEPRVVLDPNPLSEDGTIALTNHAITKDAKLMAYATSKSGSDWQEIRIRHIDTGEEYDEVIQWVKFTNISWARNDSGFFYSRFPTPGSVAPEDQSNYNRVYWHQLGTPQSEDILVFEQPDRKELGHYTIVSDDGKYLLLYVTHGTDPRNRIYYREVDSDASFDRLLDEADANYSPIGNDGTTFYFHTNLDAPRGRVVAIDLQQPARSNWKVLLPEQDEVISHVSHVNQQLVVVTRRDAHHQVNLYDMDGTHLKSIPMPMIGSISGITGKKDHSEMFLGITSYLSPNTVFRYDFATDKLTAILEPDLSFDANRYETKQVFFTSKDGTRVPMFLTHKKGLELNGNNPTLLYGYGGFNISLTPSFSTSQLVWLENGGIYAVANLRGGDEYGEEWHQAGILERKQNVFDDFISAAEWLIENNYTQSSKLAIMGRSNGGLLVAACMVQRPDLFGAVICNVPVIDMLRYHKFTVGRYWVPEYGNAETNAEHFEFMYRYSPLHNVKKGVAYPPIIIATADTDDRVVPSHAYKFAATLQAAANGNENPVLLRVEVNAGHGAGKPTSKVIEEEADFFAFLFKQFEMEYKDGIS